MSKLTIYDVDDGWVVVGIEETTLWKSFWDQVRKHGLGLALRNLIFFMTHQNTYVEHKIGDKV